MRRGETAKYVQLLGNMGDLYRAFELFSGRLASQWVATPKLHHHSPSIPVLPHKTLPFQMLTVYINVTSS